MDSNAGRGDRVLICSRRVWRRHYPTNFVSGSEAPQGGCTVGAHDHSANIAAGLDGLTNCAWYVDNLLTETFRFNLLPAKVMVTEDIARCDSTALYV